MAKYQSTLTGPQMDAALAAMPDAEAYARGTRNGQEVPSTDPTYHNNSKYYAQLAQSAFPESYATGAVRGDIDQSTQTEEWRAQARENIGITNPEWGNITGNISSQSDLTEVVSPLINQWDEVLEGGQYNSTTGVKESASTICRSKNRIPVKPNTGYYFNLTDYSNVSAFFYGSDGAFISSTTITTNSIVTTPANAYFMTFQAWKSGSTWGTNPPSVSWSINYPSTYTGYYPSKVSKVDMPWADLLWENASIGSDFSAQDISVNLSNYTFVAIEFQHYKTQGKGIVSSIRVGESACLFGMSGTNGISGDSINGALQVGARALTTSLTKVHFGNGYVSSSGGTFSQNDGCGIPIRIYGIR